MNTTRSRVVRPNELIFCQADFLASDEFTRLMGLVPADIEAKLFFNNVLQPWSLVDGSLMQDALVASGSIYWAEIPSSAGYYGIRFRPNAVGYWRLSLTYTAGQQLFQTDYDVIPPPAADGGLRSSLIKSSC